MDQAAKAREARNAYMREWRRKNKDKVRKSAENYWKRRYEREKEEEEQAQ